MTPTPANDNTPRPAWYDRELEVNLPFIRFKSRFHVPPHEVDDVVSEACILALRHWSNYRTEYKFTTWLGWIVRTAAGHHKDKRLAKMRAGKHVPVADHMVVAPADQDLMTDIAAVSQFVPAGRDGEILMRRLAGDTCTEIAADLGLHRSRIAQIEQRALGKARRAFTGRQIVRRYGRVA